MGLDQIYGEHLGLHGPLAPIPRWSACHPSSPSSQPAWWSGHHDFPIISHSSLKGNNILVLWALKWLCSCTACDLKFLVVVWIELVFNHCIYLGGGGWSNKISVYWQDLCIWCTKFGICFFPIFMEGMDMVLPPPHSKKYGLKIINSSNIVLQSVLALTCCRHLWYIAMYFIAAWHKAPATVECLFPSGMCCRRLMTFDIYSISPNLVLSIYKL